MGGWGYAMYRAAAEERVRQIRGLESLRSQLAIEMAGAADPVARERIGALLTTVKARLEATASLA